MNSTAQQRPAFSRSKAPAARAADSPPSHPRGPLHPQTRPHRTAGTSGWIAPAASAAPRPAWGARLARRCPAFLPLLLCVASASAEPLSRERQSEVLREALNSFDQAVAAAANDPQRSESLYRQAAAGFQSLIDSGARSAALEYDLANTLFRLRDTGRAIVHYRRAELLAPGDERVAANLRYARERVEPFIKPSGETELIDRLLFWNRSLSQSARFRIAAACSTAGWLLLIAWLKWRTRPLIALGVLGVLIGLANAGSVAWELRDAQARPHAVVVGSRTALRQGRGDSYEAVLKDPLGPGVELRIISQRGDWYEVRLPSDQTGWLPASAVERI